jgi:hypothetical protein
MVIVRLMGGLGNQMFQYAAARATSLRTGAELKLDLTWFDDEGRHVSPRREYALGPFDLSLDIASPEELERTLRRRGFRRRPRILVDPDLRFEPRVLTADDVRLIGYWQSERYFVDKSAEIRRDFQLPTPTSELASAITRAGSVSLHVRRGDYASDPKVESELGVLPAEYYEQAVAHLTETLAEPEFFVFSNDPDWCAANLRIDAPHTFVRHEPGARAHDDLLLMSLCRHHVVANSSFSWWGAWLGETPSTIVIAPRRWFLTSRFDTGDLVPERWLRI